MSVFSQQIRIDLDSRPASRRRPLLRAPVMPLALEPRFVLDGDGGKILGDAPDGWVKEVFREHDPVERANDPAVNPEPARILVVHGDTGSDAAAATLQQSVLEAEALLHFLAQRPDFLNLLQTAFGEAGTAAEDFAAAAENLRQSILNGTLRINVELRSFAEMQGYLAAYTASGPDGTERIYVNRDWI